MPHGSSFEHHSHWGSEAPVIDPDTGAVDRTLDFLDFAGDNVEIADFTEAPFVPALGSEVRGFLVLLVLLAGARVAYRTPPT